MKAQFTHSYEVIICLENLLGAWQEFVMGKKGKKDVQEFGRNLMDNLFNLYGDLTNCTYKHGGYQAFSICDPKPRSIHKASVRDRLVHHAIYRQLYPFFDRVFLADSYSCRIRKGTHKALNRLHLFIQKVSQNNTKTVWVLKCDVKKFFANIEHQILLEILKPYIPDHKIIRLLGEVIESFSSTRKGVGLPLGNLTSQLFVNVYMNEFDQFVKHKLKAKYYLRYADDFVFLHENRKVLEGYVPQVACFLKERLCLELHPQKIYLKTAASGVDFLGWVHFPGHRVLRTTTKKRMYRRILKNPSRETLASYLGLLKHGNTYKIKKRLSQFFFSGRL